MTILRTFQVDPKQWAEFKAKCKIKNTDASKELRAFIAKQNKKK